MDRSKIFKTAAALTAICIFISLLCPALPVRAGEDPALFREETAEADAGAYGADYRGTGLSHDNRFKNAVRKIGIDVSQWQGNINWGAVASAGVKFAIIRCGYTGMADGRRYTDPMFDKNIKMAHAAGIKVGVYYFSQAISVSEAEGEAAYAADLIRKAGVKLDLPVFMDVEIVSATSRSRMINARLSKAKETDICSSFCAYLEKRGLRSGIYSSKSYLQSRMDIGTLSKKYIVWLAHYTSKTDFDGQYTFWQHSSHGSVNGIKNRVDCDVWYDSGNLVFNTSAVASRSGWVANGSDKYYYKDGKALKGWQEISGRLYFFTKSTGRMLKGWQSLGGHKYYMGKNGNVRKGWQKIGGKTYYFSRKTGKMWTGKRVIGGKTYKFRKNGSLIR